MIETNLRSPRGAKFPRFEMCDAGGVWQVLVGIVAGGEECFGAERWADRRWPISGEKAPTPTRGMEATGNNRRKGLFIVPLSFVVYYVV